MRNRGYLSCAILAALSATIPARAFDDHNEMVKRAREAVTRRDIDVALAHLESALRSNPDSPEAFMLLGQIYLDLGRDEEATRALERAVLLHGEGSGGAGAGGLMGYALWRQERDHDAIRVLRDVLERDPRRPAVHLLLGRIHLRSGRLDEAVEEFRHEIDLQTGGFGKPGLVESSSPLGAAYEGLGVAAYRKGDDPLAVSALVMTDSLEARFHLGLALMRLDRHPDALAAFDQVLRLDPRHRGALQKLAQCAAAMGLEDARAQAVERLRRLYGEEQSQKEVIARVGSLRNTALRLTAEGDAGAASDTLRRAADLRPNDLSLLVELGKTQFEAGDAARSEETFRRILALQPFHGESHSMLGRIMADSGRMDEAVTILRRATRLSPLTTSAHIQLAQVYIAMGRIQDGLEELGFATRLNPEDPLARLNLGLGFERAGALDDAASALRGAVSLGIEGPEVHQALLRIYNRLGDTEGIRRERAILERIEDGADPSS